jgi:DNA-binding transcriptional MerR regulator
MAAHAFQTARSGDPTASPAWDSRCLIGTVAEQFGVTLRALRLYEEHGLFTPGRDALNRRYYDAEARRRLWWIMLLRRAGLGIREIKRLVSMDDRPGTMTAHAIQGLERRRAELEAELVAVNDAMARCRTVQRNGRA